MRGIDIIIDFDPDRGRFLITSPPWVAGIIRTLPNRRWDSRRGIWTAPAIRANVAHMEQTFETAKYTAAAKKAMQQVQKKAVITASVPFPRAFPFKTKPYKHQLNGLNKIHDRPVAALLCEMGTGKTKIVIDHASERCLAGFIDAVLVICPLSVRHTWAQEIARHGTGAVEHNVFMLDTTNKQAYSRWLSTPVTAKNELRWLLVGVESLAQGSAFELTQRFMLASRPVMVVDESSKIKNHRAIRTKNCISLGKMAKIRMIMSGTPVTHGIMDLFAQFEFLDPEIIGVGDFYSFRNRYAVLGGFQHKQIVGYQNTDELMGILQPHVYQVQKAEALDLPPKVYSTRMVQLNPAQTKLYKDIKSGGEIAPITVQNVLEKMLRLHQTVGGFMSIATGEGRERVVACKSIPGSNPKLDELLSVTDEMDDSGIIWAVYRWEVNMIAEALRKAGKSVVELHGDVNETERNDHVQAFQAGKAQFLVGNAATGGLGLTLTKASTVIYYSNSFSLEHRLQSEDRAHRPGQTRSVLYVDIVAQGTVDGVIIKALKSKQDVADYVRNALRVDSDPSACYTDR